MDQTAIQARADAAYGRAASFLGQNMTVFRPDAGQALIAALDARYAVGQAMVWFSPDPLLAAPRPAAPGQVVYAAVDRSTLAPGDYLVDAGQNAWFVGAVQPLLATPCVRCNRSFTLMRAVPATGPDAYGGNAPSAMATMLSAWPGFLTVKTRGISPEELVPGDTKLGLVIISLPVTPGAAILPNDLLVAGGAVPMRYTVSAAMATDWGWTIEAYYAGA